MSKRVTHEGVFGDRNFFWASAAIMSLAMFAKLTAVTIAYPYNVVMNHLRTVNKYTGKHDYVHILPTLRHIYHTDGLIGFYKGLTPQLLRSVISKAAQIYSFELFMFAYVNVRDRKRAELVSTDNISNSRKSDIE
uniref:Putative mitochondrial carrier C688.09 n=1 Tax=Lygus hesperus TaxID=30085 RepID=A0A0A9Z495_LYGHE